MHNFTERIGNLHGKISRRSQK